MSKTYRVAVVPGDGIGKEIAPAAQKVLEVVLTLSGGRLETTEFSFIRIQIVI